MYWARILALKSIFKKLLLAAALLLVAGGGPGRVAVSGLDLS